MKGHIHRAVAVKHQQIAEAIAAAAAAAAALPDLRLMHLAGLVVLPPVCARICRINFCRRPLGVCLLLPAYISELRGR